MANEFIIKHGLKIGTAFPSTDYTLLFNGENSDLLQTWDEGNGRMTWIENQSGTWPKFTIQDGGGSKIFDLNHQGAAYSIGDIDNNNNNTYITIDDSTPQVTINTPTAQIGRSIAEDVTFAFVNSGGPGLMTYKTSTNVLEWDKPLTIASATAQALIIGAGTANIDYNMVFNGQSSDGTITWMEDEGYFVTEEWRVAEGNYDAHLGDTTNNAAAHFAYSTSYYAQFATSTYAGQFYDGTRTVQMANGTYGIQASSTSGTVGYFNNGSSLNLDLISNAGGYAFACSDGTNSVELSDGTHAADITDGTNIVRLIDGTSACVASFTDGTRHVQLHNATAAGTFYDGTRQVQFADGTYAIQVTNGSVKMVNGTDINEFSIDGTLAGNSDDALPTEKAVKTYVDTLGLTYSLVDGTRAFTGTVAGITPTADSHLATKGYVDQAVSFIADYYLNDTSAGVSGTSYYEMLDEDTGEGESTFTTSGLGAGDDQALTEWITDVDVPGVTTLSAGVYLGHVHASMLTVGGKPTKIYFAIYTRTTGGSETLRATSSISDYITTKGEVELTASIALDVAINNDDRIVIKWFANIEATGNDVDVDLYAEGTNASRLSIPTTTEILSSVFVRQDGTTPLTANWDAGAFQVSMEKLRLNDNSLADVYMSTDTLRIEGSPAGLDTISINQLGMSDIDFGVWTAAGSTASFLVDGGTGLTTFNNDISMNEYLYHTGDTDTYLRFGDNAVYVYTANVEMVRYSSGNLVDFNFSQQAADFRIRTDNVTDAVFVDGSADTISFGVPVELGNIEIEEDSGAVTLVNMSVSATPTIGTEESYSFQLDSTDILKVYSEADGAGSIQNPRVDVTGTLTVNGDTSYAQANADDLVIGDGSALAGLTIATSSTVYGSIHFSDTTSGVGQYDGLIRYYHNDRSMEFFTAGALAMSIDSSHHVGMGVAPNASYGLALHDDGVVGGMYISGANAPGITMHDTTDTGKAYVITQNGGSLLLYADPDDTAAATIFKIEVDGNEVLEIDSTLAVQFNNAYSFPTSTGTVGQVLKLQSGNATLDWEDDTSGVTTLAALTDVSIPTPSDGQVLTYNASGSVWTAEESSSVITSYTEAFVDGDLDSSSLITINHSLDSNYPNVSIYDDNGNMISPDEITNTDSNNTTLDLSSFVPLSGTWNVRISVGSGGSPSGGNPVGTVGAIQFTDGSNFDGDADELYWDNVNHRLGLNDSSPSYKIDAVLTDGNDGINAVYGSARTFLGFASGEGGLSLYDSSGVEQIRLRSYTGFDSYINGNLGLNVSSPSSELDVAGDIEVGSTDAHYWGDPTTDGSWRFTRSGNDFVIQRRESSSWVTKQTVLA